MNMERERATKRQNSSISVYNEISILLFRIPVLLTRYLDTPTWCTKLGVHGCSVAARYQEVCGAMLQLYKRCWRAPPLLQPAISISGRRRKVKTLFVQLCVT